MKKMYCKPTTSIHHIHTVKMLANSLHIFSNSNETVDEGWAKEDNGMNWDE